MTRPGRPYKQTAPNHCAVIVSARTHTRVMRLRDALELKTLAQVVDLVTRGIR